MVNRIPLRDRSRKEQQAAFANMNSDSVVQPTIPKDYKGKKIIYPPKKEKLNRHLVIYVPSTEYDKQISTSKFKKRIDETEAFLSKNYKGYTKISAKGGYVADDGTLIEEPVVKVECFSKDRDYKKQQNKLKDFIDKKIKEWKQESIGVEFEEDMHFIKAEKKKLKRINKSKIKKIKQEK